MSTPRYWRTPEFRSQRPARSLRRRRVTPKPLAFGAADKNEGDVSVKWQSNHFVKGQSGDTYVPFTLAVDKAQLSKGAALYVRIVSAEQASAFASAMVATATPPKDGKATPPPRPSFQWDSVHFLDAPDGQLSRAVQLKPGQYVAFIALKEKSPAPAGNQRNNRNNDKNAPPAAARCRTGGSAPSRDHGSRLQHARSSDELSDRCAVG